MSSEYEMLDYEDQLKKSQENAQKFICDLLSECRDLGEAKIMLSMDTKMDEYFTNFSSTEWEYKRLDYAMNTQCIGLISHDHSQRLYRDQMGEAEGIKIKKNKRDDSDLFISGIKMLSSPMFAFLHLLFMMLQLLRIPTSPLKKCFPFYFFKIPMNRLLGHINSHLCFIVLLVLHLERPNGSEIFSTTWYDMLLGVWTVAFLFRHIERLTSALWINLRPKHSKIQNQDKLLTKICNSPLKLWTGRYGYTFWEFWSCIFIIAGVGMKYMEATQNCSIDNRVCTWKFSCDESYLSISHQFLGVGTTLLMLRLFQWFELHHIVGPTVISLRSVIPVIGTVLITHLVILVAFTTGLHFSLRTSNSYCDEEYESYGTRTNYPDVSFVNSCNSTQVFETGDKYTLSDSKGNQFRTFPLALKTSFWSLFDPGQPNVIGCTRGFTQTVGLWLWGCYQVINAIVAINLLIALMNTKISDIEINNKDVWRFAKAQVWRQYFNNPFILPIPFNLVEIPLQGLLSCTGGADTEHKKEDLQKKKEDYFKLVTKLCRRYMEKRDMLSTKTSLESIQVLLESIQRENPLPAVKRNMRAEQTNSGK